ncbi:MAG TPA: carboxypeptidase-like regulatory domain-containing protein [Pyrinomonadaceae bacterium]|jgi:hypothetical protein
MKIKLTCIFVFIFAFALAAESFSQARTGGAVSGKLLKANGKPLAYTEIELVPVDSNKIVIDPRLVAISSTNGAFAFANVPDGKYTLSINFDDKPTDLSPYGTFFYPKTPNRHEAQIFEIRGQSKLTNLIFQLPAALAQRKIAGKVVYPGGKPVSGAFIALRDVSFDQSVLFGIAKTDKNGIFSVTAFERRGYQFGAILFEKDAPSIYEARSRIIAAGESDIFTLDASTPVIQIELKTTEDLKRIKDKYIAMTINDLFERNTE